MKNPLPRAFGGTVILLASFISTVTHAADISPAEMKAIATEG